MDDSYALDRHVSASIKGLLLRRFSWPHAWATIQNMWRWGALDSREPAPLWKGQTLNVEWLKGGRCWIDPWSPSAMEGMERTYPELVEAFRSRSQ